VDFHQVRAADGVGEALVHIKPRDVVPCRWSAVDFIDMRGADFDRLRASVAHAGGNVLPIKVRPTWREVGNDARGERQVVKAFEIVFGNSRLHACYLLGLPVLAVVEDLSDVQAAEQFAAEFLWDRRWRPWRMSRFVQRVLDHGLYPSIRRAADGLGMDLEDVSILNRMATWPEPLRRALQSVEFTRTHARRISRFEPETLARFTDEGLPYKKRTAAMVMRRLEQLEERA
jgi:ParB family transcriptional regulator, chromosome partitioning protein